MFIKKPFPPSRIKLQQTQKKIVVFLLCLEPLRASSAGRKRALIYFIRKNKQKK